MGAGSEMNGHCLRSSLSSMAFCVTETQCQNLRAKSRNLRNLALPLIPPWRLWWWEPISRAGRCSLCAACAPAVLSQHCGPDKHHNNMKQIHRGNKLYLYNCNQSAIETSTPAIMLQPRFCRLLMMLLSAIMFACWMSLARFSSPIPTWITRYAEIVSPIQESGLKLFY